VRPLATLLACVVVCVLGARSAPPALADAVYWANSAGQRLSFANLGDSTGGDLSTSGATVATPSGVALDLAADRIYWANRAGNKISFASLGGGGGGDLVTTGATVSGPSGVAIDPAAGRIYWANSAGNKISFASLNGSGGAELSTSGATVSNPAGVAIDPAAGRIYWANSGGNKISFASLDGSGGGDLVTTGATVSSPVGVALDPVGGRIYWANNAGDKISFARLDGSGGADVATGDGPEGVAIDPDGNRVYWANEHGNTVSFAKLDGSGQGNVATGPATLNGPTFPVLASRPVGTGVPAISIAPTSPSGRSLQCSQGSWAPDSLGSFIYRTPRSLAFQWTSDGVDIAGETGPELATATFAPRHVYRCAVTASNAAGSTTQTSAGVTEGTNRTPPTAPDKATFTSTRSRIRVSSKRSFRFAFEGDAGSHGSAVFKSFRTIARKSFTVHAGDEVILRIRLSAKTYRVLRRHHRTRVHVTVTLTNDSGLTSRSGKTFTLYA
jgi:DNA-binding beta-propeller fold protein YncE